MPRLRSRLQRRSNSRSRLRCPELHFRDGTRHDTQEHRPKRTLPPLMMMLDIFPQDLCRQHLDTHVLSLAHLLRQTKVTAIVAMRSADAASVPVKCFLRSRTRQTLLESHFCGKFKPRSTKFLKTPASSTGRCNTI